MGIHRNPARQNKEYDDKRRAGGGFPVGPPGAIDKGYRPTLAMTDATFHMCGFIGAHAIAEPEIWTILSTGRTGAPEKCLPG